MIQYFFAVLIVGADFNDATCTGAGLAGLSGRGEVLRH